MHATVHDDYDDGPRDDEHVVLRDVPWETYEALDAARGESAHPRLTYLDGVLELLSPSDEHEGDMKALARLLEAWAYERDAEITGLGSTTFKDKLKKVGLEPDECYSVGRKPDGPPDIALEVARRRYRAVNKLAAYARLGVPEVWVWHRGRLQVHRLRGETYEPIPKSELLPDLDIELLVSFANHPDQPQALRLLKSVLRGERP